MTLNNDRNLNSGISTTSTSVSGASNAGSGGYYGSYYSLTFEIRFKCNLLIFYRYRWSGYCIHVTLLPLHLFRPLRLCQ